MTDSIQPITAGKQHAVFSACAAVLDQEPRRRHLFRGGFAYATLAGVERLRADLCVTASWGRIRKEFLVGIHHAITEPSAIKELCAMPKSEVRVFLPRGRMERQALNNTPVFHPKVIALCSPNGSKVRLVQAGSPNLTGAAMGARPRNHEIAVALDGGSRSCVDQGKVFVDWWLPLWKAARPATPQLIRRYASLRKAFLQANPVLRSSAEMPEGIRNAEYFFVEVGAGSGPPDARHQVEFPQALVRFFGRAVRRRRNICLKRGTEKWERRPLSFKTTTFGVDIWRLGMPTQSTGGDPIAGRAILFKRTSTSGQFEFLVADVDSPVFDNWVNTANLSGHIGATHGAHPRQYGFYGSKG